MIEKLTAKQEIRLVEVREEWLKTGLSTERANHLQTEKTITEMYGLIGKKVPRFIWMDSPFGAMISISLAKKCMKMGANLGANLGDNLRANLGDNLRDNLRANLGDNLRANLGDNLRDNLWDNLGANLWDNLGDNLGDNLRANLGDLYDPNYFFGSFDSYWVAYYKFANEIGVPYSKQDSAKLELWASLARSCFWWWPYENVCFLSDRPKAIHRNARGQLHNESGLSIEFHDGYGMFCLNGIRMKALDVTTAAEKLDPKDVMKRENVDERRELIRKIGIERMLSVLNSKVLDKKGDYSLLSVELSDEIKDARFLKMLNPSIKIWHLEGVARECSTVQHAINWRAGDIKADWQPAQLT